MQPSRNFDIASIAYSSSSPVIEIDTANCESVLFLAIPGTTAARTGSIALAAGNSTATFVSCSSTYTMTSTGATRDLLALEVHKPAKRWLQATYSATADMEARMVAIKFGLRESVTSMSAAAVTNFTVPVVAGGIKRVVSPTSAT